MIVEVGMVLGTGVITTAANYGGIFLQMLPTLLLDQLGAIGLGEAMLALGAYLLIAVVLGAILYSWIRHTRRVKDLHRRGLITSAQRTPEEKRAHMERKKKIWRVVAVLVLVLVLFALYQG